MTRTLWISIVVLATLTVVTLASVRAEAASCTKDTDCPGTECGSQVCDWTSGTPTCVPAGTKPQHLDGWCAVTADCKCAAQGAWCSTPSCTFTVPTGRPASGGGAGAGGASVPGASGASGAGAGGVSGSRASGTGTAGTAAPPREVRRGRVLYPRRGSAGIGRGGFGILRRARLVRGASTSAQLKEEKSQRRQPESGGRANKTP